MKLDLTGLIMQTALLLCLAPLVTGLMRNWKARLQNRRGPRIWQPCFDLVKLLRKDMVISEHASWIFSAAPYVIFAGVLLAGLMVPMVNTHAPLSLFGGALALVGLLALGRFFLALAGLDPATAFGGQQTRYRLAVEGDKCSSLCERRLKNVRVRSLQVDAPVPRGERVDVDPIIPQRRRNGRQGRREKGRRQSGWRYEHLGSSDVQSGQRCRSERRHGSSC